MRYTRNPSVQYNLRSKRQVQKLLRLKPAGPWSRELLSSEAGKILEAEHMRRARSELEKAKPRSTAQLKAVIKKAADTPQQRLVTLYETSLQRPLTESEFLEYTTLFKECFPKAYKGMYGNKSPKQIVAECISNQRKNG
jgi:hypothetical protein